MRTKRVYCELDAEAVYMSGTRFCGAWSL